MCRRFIFLLCLLLPLQFAWAAASAYCQHEPAGARAGHFGHHFHEHPVNGTAAESASQFGSGSGGENLPSGPVYDATLSATDRASDDAGKPASLKFPDGKFAAHADCVSCHTLNAPAIAGDAGVADSAAVAAPPRFSQAAPRLCSAPSRVPDRPQWLRLA